MSDTQVLLKICRDQVDVMSVRSLLEAGQEVCLLLFEATASEPAVACPDCDQAWTFTAQTPEAEIDVDGACARLGPTNNRWTPTETSSANF